MEENFESFSFSNFSHSWSNFSSPINFLFSLQQNEETNQQLFKIFLERRELINSSDEFGRTPLHLAVNQNNSQRKINNFFCTKFSHFFLFEWLNFYYVMVLI